MNADDRKENDLALENRPGKPLAELLKKVALQSLAASVIQWVLKKEMHVYADDICMGACQIGDSE